MKQPINVTKPYLPDINKYQKYLDRIYKSNWLTNHGPLVQELERRLEDYLGVKNLILVSNGTSALQIAYKTLEISGEVITTPFSFVATTSSLVWDGLKPVFADINPKTFNIDPTQIESKITKETSAILPVHVFGNACEIENIKNLADRYKLKVIYDAAHAFGVTYRDNSVLNHGDISTISFHATKLFHTIEGGALIIKNDDAYKKAQQLTNFGFEKGEISGIGINSKMNEFSAAMGLSILDDIDVILEKREVIWETYYTHLKDYVVLQERNPSGTNNFHYFPIVFSDEKKLLHIEKKLKDFQIYPRRYFYPSLDTLEYINPKQTCPSSRDISIRILCLPIYPGLTNEEQMNIIKIIKENI